MINSTISQVIGAEMALNIIFTTLSFTLTALSHVAVRWCGIARWHTLAANDSVKEGETPLSLYTHRKRKE